MGIFKTPRAASPIVQGLICPNFEIIQAVMNDLATFKKEENPTGNEAARVVTILSINFKMLKSS